MEQSPVVFSNGVSARCFSYSEDIVCVEVEKDGKEFGSFCSDVKQFEEWDEEELVLLVEQHIKQTENALRQKKRRHPLYEDIEMQYYTHSSDVYCINIYEGDLEVSSFCTDRLTFEEWMEDKDSLIDVVKKLITKEN
ncbi:hypothetical protein [Evansella tamaricis]|uniref:Uncharacterized protein n=1 Tax=Evansella tamaricis TaxID=2069301 RepID=A0ABS6JFP2_9BACI|nr:hypothetical protein [Evansella tamaricis]MBU9712215.1 hypothetical protein [Evansella tamaricis]